MSKKNDLKQILKNYAEAYYTACDESRKEVLAQLKPGQIAPADGRIHNVEMRSRFAHDSIKYAQHAAEIFEGMIRDVKKEMAAPPSTEAVNMISMLKMRTNVPVEEYENLIEQYGSNYQTAKAIRSIAAENGHRIYTTGLEDKLHDLEQLNASFQRTFTLASAERGGLSSGSIAFQEMILDDVLGDAE